MHDASCFPKKNNIVFPKKQNKVELRHTLFFFRMNTVFACVFFSDLATATEASPKDPTTGRDLVAARHRMVGLLRATLTVHQRGGGGEEEVRCRNFGVSIHLFINL